MGWGREAPRDAAVTPEHGPVSLKPYGGAQEHTTRQRAFGDTGLSKAEKQLGFCFAYAHMQKKSREIEDSKIGLFFLTTIPVHGGIFFNYPFFLSL